MLRFVTAFAGALALLMVGLTGPALAQGQRPTGGLITSGVIQRIVVEGNNRVEADTVRSYLTVATGDPFDPGKMDASLKTLFATGLFADVSFARQGDDLVIKVVENPIINRIQLPALNHHELGSVFIGNPHRRIGNEGYR